MYVNTHNRRQLFPVDEQMIAYLLDTLLDNFFTLISEMYFVLSWYKYFFIFQLFLHPQISSKF